MFVCPAGSFRLHLVLHEKVGEKQTMLAFFSWLKISTCNTKGIENRNQVCVTRFLLWCKFIEINQKNRI